MKILIVNPIIYTSETKKINRADTVKDTMIYDLCLAFEKNGADVTLAAAEDFKPTAIEDYPFRIVWLETKLKKLCPVNTLPYCPGVKRLAKNGNFDLIITSEVFSLNSLMLAVHSKENLIVWHELAKHNKIFHGAASKIWYSFVARIFFKNVLIAARSIQAKKFISQYCNNVSDIIIDHGVNLDKFTYDTQKDNIFCVSSQLIARKQIDKIITCFGKYLKKYNASSLLYIMGNGEEEKNLKSLSEKLGIDKNVIFTGKLPHDELVKILRKSKAMLVYTRKDNNMVSVVESIAVATPVITTGVPYNASYIEKYSLGIVNDTWNEDDINEIAENKNYIKACIKYRNTLSTDSKVNDFMRLYKELKNNE